MVLEMGAVACTRAVATEAGSCGQFGDSDEWMGVGALRAGAGLWRKMNSMLTGCFGGGATH